MKRITPLKLTCVGAFVAALGMGCASTGYARYDADLHENRDSSVGAAAQMDTGTDRDTIAVDTAAVEGEDRVTVSALSFSPETRANWVNKFPFYDNNWNLRVIETHTFVADEDADLAEFTTAMRPGSAYAEAAGGASGISTGGARVIQHSPNPR
jgi:hypothetical protein